jgi:Cyclin M transmembrane N-terminal domain
MLIRSTIKDRLVTMLSGTEWHEENAKIPMMMMLVVRRVTWLPALLLLLLVLLQQGSLARSIVDEEDDDDDNEAIRMAIATLQASNDFVVCAVRRNDILDNGEEDDPFSKKVPLCSHVLLPEIADARRLQEERQEEEVISQRSSSARWVTFTLNAIGAFVCVTLAALAAGLTLGLLGLDPLVLLIKERAGTDEKERQMARKLLPVIQQHHRLLVTLLLLNACANEALPLFLEALVSPAMAVIISVTLVLFFGEIIPSAIFTGPDQLRIATNLLPLVRCIMWLAYPVAYPIAKLLDLLLHEREDDDDDDGDGPRNRTSAAYTRGELSALIRIQYEERLAKRRHKQKKIRQIANNIIVHNNNNHYHEIGGGAFDNNHFAAASFASSTTSSQRASSFHTTRNQTSHSERRDFFDIHGSIRHDEGKFFYWQNVLSAHHHCCT